MTDDRRESILLAIWLSVFTVSAAFIVWFCVVFGPRVSAAGTYTSTITTTSPCARSTREVRFNHGAEDDLCAAWIGPRGRVHVGPLSDAPARANIVGG